MNPAETTLTAESLEDPARFFWYGVYLLIMGVTALPLFGLRVPQMLSSYMTLLVIHEASGFFFFGHTFFSNIWAMRLRMTQGPEVGVWARAFLRKLALGVTLPTSIISPLAGLMLIESWGGLQAAPWAWDAYLAFWIMAGVSIVPDVIRYGRNRNSGNPRHGIVSGAIRGNIGTVLTFYIIWCMITKQALIAPMIFI
jgi:hypothetical protein